MPFATWDIVQVLPLNKQLADEGMGLVQNDLIALGLDDISTL